jgi:hypothetical protein
VRLTRPEAARIAVEVRVLTGVKTLARKQLLSVIRAVPDFWQAQAKRSKFNTAQS